MAITGYVNTRQAPVRTNWARPGVVNQPSRKVWLIGDSLTKGTDAGGGALNYDTDVYSSLGQGGIWFQPGAYATWAMLASECRWTVAGVFATGGYTSAQVLATHVPSVLAAATAGDTVVVMSGTNDYINADVEEIHETLRVNGLNTVAVTVPPKSNVFLITTLTFNEVLKDYAFSNGIPVADIHAELADPTTGLLAGFDSGDGVHPNVAGCRVVGDTIAATLNKCPWMGDPISLVNHNGVASAQLQTKPLALGTPVSGTDYNTLATIGTGTFASATVNAFRGGSGYVATRGDTDMSLRFAVMTLTAGHTYRVGMALKASVTSTGAWAMNLQSHVTGLKKLWSMGGPTYLITGESKQMCRFYSEFTVPAGLPDYSYRLRLTVNGASSVVSIGELTMLDLTAIGL